MIIAKERIRHNGEVYCVDDVINDINNEDAERLVNLGVASFIPQYNIDGNVNANEKVNPDIRGLLDDSFTATELKDAAKEIGLEFPGNVSKANLIELIISSNKAEEIMEVEFEEYEEDDE